MAGGQSGWGIQHETITFPDPSVTGDIKTLTTFNTDIRIVRVT